MGLIERIAFHLEGTETTFSRDESGAPTHIEKSWGPERWIRAAASGRMTAIDLLAVIVFQDYLTPGIDAQAVAEGWLAELRRAVEAGEVTPRDYSTLLPCRQEFERLEWVISKADAVAFLERRQSAIDLEATVAHLLGVVLRAGETHYHPGTGEPMQTLWDAGFMPTDGREATPASVEPVEWCGMLPVFRAELPCAERGRQSPPEPAQAAEAPAHAPSASASPAARPEAVAVPAAPEAPDIASAPAVVHRVGNRAHSLDGVIAEARRRAVRDDWLTVWGELTRMAERPDRPAPLMGYAPGEGLKVQSDDPEGFTTYSREAFRKRWGRRNKG